MSTIAPDGDRFGDAPGASLAARTARGSVVNAVFLAAINVLGLVKGFAAASLLGASEYGVWGLIALSTGLLFWLAAVGIDDKYLQQDDPDQEAAFQVAFTLQCGLAALLAVAILVAMPVLSAVYDAPEMVGPGMALALAMPALALQSPLWIFWRRMDFLRQRSLQIWDPVVSLVAVVALLAAGLGVWGIVLGSLAGSYAAAIAAVRASPYRLRLRAVRGEMGEYASFSWPLFAGAGSAVVAGVVPALVASRTAGLAAVGAITLASTIAQFANRVDEILSQVVYPAVCSVKDRRDLMFAAFSKSNRLALLWAAPIGAGVALFAPEVVDRVAGGRWSFAAGLIQIFAVTAALNQIGGNWTAFYRAIGRTRPIAVVNGVLLAAVLAVAVPLLARDGIEGYGIGMAIATGLALLVRMHYLARLFPALSVLAHIGRALAPTGLAVACVLALRVPPPAEAAVFAAVAVIASLWIERELLREIRGLLREGGRPEGFLVRA